MIGHSFFFNAVFFSYGVVAKRFFHVSEDDLPMRLLPFAIGSFFGPLLLGRLFDKIIGLRPTLSNSLPSKSLESVSKPLQAS